MDTLETGNKSVVFGEVFQHKVEGDLFQYHGKDFREWYAVPAADKIIPMNFEGINPLKEYVLPTNMKDSQLYVSAKATYFSEQEFSMALYALIVDPELGNRYLNYQLQKGKYYIFHVVLDNNMALSFYIFWFGWKWDCHACEFGRSDGRDKGDILLYSPFVREAKVIKMEGRSRKSNEEIYKRILSRK